MVTERLVARHMNTTRAFFAAASIVFQYLVSPTQAQPSLVISQQVRMIDEGTLIRVPVRVFGRTNYFIVDTGSTLSAFDSSSEAKLGTPLDEVRQENALADGVKTKIYAAPDIFLGESKLDVGRVSCSDLSLGRLITGEPCDGILGMDVLKDYTVVLIFGQSTLALCSQTPDEFKRRGNAITSLVIASTWISVISREPGVAISTTKSAARAPFQAPLP